MGSPTDERSPEPGTGAGAAACDWTELAAWIGELCTVDSPCLPAALWVLTMCTSPLELFHPTAEERQIVAQLGAAAEELGVLTEALVREAAASSMPRDASTLWSDFADVVRRLFQRAPAHFTVPLSFLCSFGEVFAKRPKQCQPTPAELEALLDDLDRRRPYLVPGVLKIMVGNAHAEEVAARWRPPERPREHVIAGKLIAFMLRVLEQLRRADEKADRLHAELVESFPQIPLCALEVAPEATLVKLPLETLLTLEQVVDDDCLSIAGKIGAIHQLVTGPGPVPH